MAVESCIFFLGGKRQTITHFPIQMRYFVALLKSALMTAKKNIQLNTMYQFGLVSAVQLQFYTLNLMECEKVNILKFVWKRFKIEIEIYVKT